nr:DUF4388 domain-containing protein [Planctomycetota bacterium]
MALSGSLRTLSLPEIFQTLGRSNGTGVLRLTSVDGRVDVVFDNGVVRDMLHRGKDRMWTLIERLVAMGVVGPEAMDASSSGSFGSMQALILQGHLTEQQAVEALHDHTFDELCNLFTWDNANFVFIEDTADDATIVQALDQARKLDVKIEVQALLMESARRLDEWHQVLPDLPPDDAVVAFAPGREMEREQRFGEYPERPVMAMIDGVRSIGEITFHTPITRMDVHSVLYDAVCEGVLEVLSVDQMESRGKALIENQDFERGARLLRACLSLEPERKSAMGLLAEALEHSGDGAEASGCFSQLALSYLAEGHQDEAVRAARRASELGATDSQQLVLVRCLLESGDTGAAVVELMAIAARLMTQDRLEDARGTLLKVLQLDAGNEDARHELAQIQSRTSGEHSAQVVVCVECGASNDRGQNSCSECGAPLHLTCRSCNRAVAISDRICVFCGVNPHVETVGKGGELIAPSTTTLIRKEDVGSGKHDSVRARMGAAKAAEAESRYADALAIWKDLSLGQEDNRRLQRHIRQLEGLVHDSEVESLIERGHNLRHKRRYHAALASYQRAQRAIALDDPRSQRLRDLIVSTRKSSQFTSLIYGVAVALLLVVGWLVVQPIYELRGFKKRVETLERQVSDHIARAVSPNDFVQLSALVPDSLGAEADRLGEEARIVFDALRARIEATRLRLGKQTLDDIETQIDAGSWSGAITAIDDFRRIFGGGVDPDRRQRLEDLIDERRKLQGQAPARLAEIEGRVASDELEL